MQNGTHHRLIWSGKYSGRAYVAFQQVRTSNAVADKSVVLTINLKRFERVDEVYGELVLDANCHCRRKGSTV